MEDPDETSDEEFDRVTRVVALIAGYYSVRHICKNPCRTSVLTGAAWVAELEEGNPKRIFESLRMPKRVFRNLCAIVERNAPLSPWANVQTNEKVAMFLYCLSRSASNNELQERFQHSGETVHRHFHAVLEVISSLAPKYIVLPTTASAVLAQQPKFAEHFSKCRLAFDGTHIPAFVSDEDAKPYRDRTGGLSQNVFAACTFDMQFAFVMAGWEGSAADSTVLADARRKGFVTPPGLFDLGDAGYRLSMEVLTPYRGVRYHLREWGQVGERPQNYKELYNLRHAEARNIIERAFGVLKRRFPILLRAPEYCVTTQAKIVLACCVLHNFIRRQGDSEDDPEGELEDGEIVEIEEAAGGRTTETRNRTSDAEAKAFRDRLAKAMWDSYPNRLIR